MDKLLSGQVSHQLDQKNRIRIPSKYKNAFPEGETIFFVHYNNDCLFIMPDSSLQRRLARYSEVNTSDKKLLDAKRTVMRRIYPIEEDTQGRTVLSQSLRTTFGIVKDVVTIGMGDYLELWARERLEAEDEAMPSEEAFRILGF